MPPLRIGLIGLSVAGSWAEIAHLQHLHNSPDYEIVALANSSLASSQAAIKKHSLPKSVIGYDSPEALVADRNVELVVCSTNVLHHYFIAEHALTNWKMVTHQLEDGIRRMALGQNHSRSRNIDFDGEPKKSFNDGRPTGTKVTTNQYLGKNGE